MRKSDEIEELVERARFSATGSGGRMDEALRNEFATLARSIQSGSNPGFTPAEVANIERIARGEGGRMGMRFLSQLAPGMTARGMATTAAQVGGIGIAPGANLSDSVACFEATHGTAPKYAGKDYVNPGSEILSAEMMLRHMGWVEAADLIISSMEKSILSKKVTYDFARLMEGATQVSCSGFGQVMIENM
jgi:hypothetical protein